MFDIHGHEASVINRFKDKYRHSPISDYITMIGFTSMANVCEMVGGWSHLAPKVYKSEPPKSDLESACVVVGLNKSPKSGTDIPLEFDGLKVFYIGHKGLLLKQN